MSRIAIVSGGRDLFRGQPNIVRRNELAFLDVHHAAGAARLDQKIGLAAQERRDLQDVDGLGGFGRLRRLVNVGEHGESRVADGLQNSQAFLQAGAAIGIHARPVGFVERRFENERPDRAFAISCARKWTCSSLSMTQGPAISASGAPPPISMTFGDVIRRARARLDPQLRPLARSLGHRLRGAPAPRR